MQNQGMCTRCISLEIYATRRCLRQIDFDPELGESRNHSVWVSYRYANINVVILNDDKYGQIFLSLHARIYI